MRKFNVLLLIGLLAMSGPTLAADPDERVDPAQHLAQLLLETEAEYLVERFAGSGLADQDIKRIVLQTLDGLARCMIAAVEKSQLPLAKQFRDFLSRAPSLEEFDAWEASWSAQDGDNEIDVERALEACLLKSEQAAGLTPGHD